MTSIDPPNFKVNIISTEYNQHALSVISGCFFNVRITDTNNGKSLSGILLINQQLTSECLSKIFSANLWLDVKNCQHDKHINIDIIKEFELLHLLDKEKRNIHLYLPLTCEADIVENTNEALVNKHSEQYLIDEFLL